MSSRPAAVPRTPQIDGLIREAARHGLDIMEALLRQTRDALRRQIDQTRDLDARDAKTRAMSVLAHSGPELRTRFPEALKQAFERELNDNPVSTSRDSGPSSLKFDQLELMDEGQVQMRINAVRGLQQALMETEHELTELNTLVSAILGFDQVRPERNPFRPEVFVEALQRLISEVQGEAAAQTQCRQVMVPLLGQNLRMVYKDLLGYLKQQNVRPVGYVIQRSAVGSAGAATGLAMSSPDVAYTASGYAASGHVALKQAAASARSPAMQSMMQQAQAGQLTVQQLHGLISGTAGVRQDSGGQLVKLAQEVVSLFVRNIAGDPNLLSPVRQLILGLEPALQQLARTDLHFFSDKKHPARVLLEEVAQHSFAYGSERTEGFARFMDTLEMPLLSITPSTAQTDAFGIALAQLREAWDAEGRRAAQQKAAVQALQQADRRNALARQIAQHIHQQPGTTLVPDLVAQFACGPWAQVMAQAQMAGKVGQPGEPDHVALLEDLFWSVRPDQTRQHPGQLTQLIPRLIQGLKRGLASIQYPEDRSELFFAQLFALHQGGIKAVSPVRDLQALQPSASTWLAPTEARETGFMDSLGAEETAKGGDFPATVPASGDFAATVPIGLVSESVRDFPATEPMGLVEPSSAAYQQTPETVAPDTLSLDQLQLGSWVELLASGQWTRLQLIWLSDNAGLCLFSSGSGANHSMTRRMFDRLVSLRQLRLVAQGGVVERAFDAVAELAMRNSVYMDIRDDPSA